MQINLSIALALTITAASSVSAQSVVNGSFETFAGTLGSDNGAQLNVGATALTGWTIINGEIGYLRNSNAYSLSASSGIGFLDLGGYSDSGFPKGVSQLVAGFTIGQSYTLSIDLGLRNGVCVNGGSNCGGPVQVSASAGASSQTFTHASSVAGDVWSRFNVVFVAPSSSVTIAIQGVSLPSGNKFIGLDNVSIKPIPEPATVSLMFAGFLIISGCAIRQRSQMASLAVASSEA